MEEFKLQPKKWILAGILLCLVGLPALAQTPEQEVEAVIRSLFDGMKQKNEEQVAAAFSSEGLMQTVQQKPEGTTVGSNSVADFVKRIANTPAGTVLDERILSLQNNRQHRVGSQLAIAAIYRFINFVVQLHVELQRFSTASGLLLKHEDATKEVAHDRTELQQERVLACFINRKVKI